MPIDSSIRQIIKNEGYIKIDDMMRHAMSANDDSYYKATTSLGKDGDFTTAPETSQLFGEIIALSLIEQWKILGSPEPCSIVELGPGHGILIKDILRVIKLVPEFYNAIKLSLLEINPHFIVKQKSNLAQHPNIETKWIDTLQNIPKIPTIFIANEFFDALPIKQYMKKKHQWYELIIIEDPISGLLKYDNMNISDMLQNHLLSEHMQAPDGAIIEESIESLNIVASIANQLHQFKGASYIIDYGYNINVKNRLSSQYNATLQAIKNHEYSPILSSLGESDISAHVDFNALQSTMTQHYITDSQFYSQKDFLIKYGIQLRAHELKKTASQDDKNIIDKQTSYLISKQYMGELFKILISLKI